MILLSGSADSRNVVHHPVKLQTDVSLKSEVNRNDLLLQLV
jgi:hypothetical protein